jgi:hypothetical protein
MFGGNTANGCLQANIDPGPPGPGPCATAIIPIVKTLSEHSVKIGFGGCMGFGGIPAHGCGVQKLIPLHAMGCLANPTNTVGTPVLINPGVPINGFITDATGDPGIQIP